MTDVRVHDVELVRNPEPSKIRVHNVELLRTPPPPEPAKVYVTDVFLTLGLSPPSGPGASRVRVSGAWQTYLVRTRWNGVWA